MRSYKTCTETVTKEVPRAGELYRFFDTSGGNCLVVAGPTGFGFVVDKGNSQFSYGTISFSGLAKFVHLPNAVIVTNE